MIFFNGWRQAELKEADPRSRPPPFICSRSVLTQVCRVRFAGLVVPSVRAVAMVKHAVASLQREYTRLCTKSARFKTRGLAYQARADELLRRIKVAASAVSNSPTGSSSSSSASEASGSAVKVDGASKPKKDTAPKISASIDGASEPTEDTAPKDSTATMASAQTDGASTHKEDTAPKTTTELMANVPRRATSIAKRERLPQPSIKLCWTCWRKYHKLRGGSEHKKDETCFPGKPCDEVKALLSVSRA